LSLLIDLGMWMNLLGVVVLDVLAVMWGSQVPIWTGRLSRSLAMVYVRVYVLVIHPRHIEFLRF